MGDAQATLRQLLSCLNRNENRKFLRQAQEGMKTWRALMAERATAAAKPMRSQAVTHHLPDLLDSDAVICGDSGTVTVWQARMELREQQRFSFSGTMCSMMAALPYAIGASTAFRRGG